MAGMEFEYDEKGGTFYYFLLSFLALLIIPATYYLWQGSDGEDDFEKKKKKCMCEPCMLKRQRLKSAEPWKKTKRNLIRLGLIMGWVITILVAYKASQVELDFTEFDPFSELGIDREATKSEIRSAYRKLSLVWHPDKDTGDEKKFMRITRAYKALTDEEARKNWEEYNNPDGPGAMVFGIALPKWIIEKENSVWVLAVYGLVFMIILPVAVGSWWYRSIKFSADQILMETTQLYVFFFQKTPNMVLKRAIMILGSSMEFEKGHNNEIVVRQTDNEEIPQLMKELPKLNEKNKEKPLCYPFSIKARALLHAHYSRIDLPPESLEFDKQYILSKCPYLLNEMVNIVAQLVAWYHLGKVSYNPRLETMENVMKISQMVIQALWDNQSALLQLPHIREDMLRHFTNKRRNIRAIKQFVMLKDEERRALLRTLSEQEYKDVMCVCATMPYVRMNIESKVIDEEDSTITAGSIVTVTVNLVRENMEVLFNKEGLELEEEEIEEVKDEVDDEEEEANEDKETSEKKSPVKAPVWEKQNKKKKGKGPKKPVNKKTTKTKYVVKTITPAATNKEEKEPDTPNQNENKSIEKRKTRKRRDTGDSNEDYSQSEDEENASDDNASEKSKEEDEEEWNEFQQDFKRENILETKSKKTHLVHCPRFPDDKYEWYWLYVADRKNHLIITAPVQVCSLRTEEVVQLKFYAPNKQGQYQYSVHLRSDSYFDCDLSSVIKLDVKAAKEVKDHPQWDISDDEDEENKEEENVTESDESYEASDDD